MHIHEISTRTPVELLIAFADFTRYTVGSAERPNTVIAEMLHEMYGKVTQLIEEAGGHVIKFIGDASLIVFEQDVVDEGIVALLALKSDLDAWLPERGWTGSQLIVKAHYGEVIAGPYGPKKCFDIIGSAVNTAATIPSRGFAISVPAFRKLSAQTRKRFKKHTPPVTYIRTEDRH